MGNRKIIIFFLLVISACAVALFGLRRGSRLLRPEAESGAALVDEPLDEIDHIAIERGDSRIGLLRQKNRWMMTAPFPAEVDQGAVLKFLDAFENARIRDAMLFDDLRRRGLSLRELGFDPPAAHVILEGRGRRMAFRIGAPSPLKNDLYVRCGDSSQIVVVSARLAAAIPLTADDIRSREVAHAEPSAIAALEIRSPGKPFMSLAKEPSGWTLRQPSAAPASSRRVEELLRVLCAARVERYVWPTVSNVMDVAESESALKARRSLYGLDDERGVKVAAQAADGSAAGKWVFGVAAERQPGLSYMLLDNGEAIGLVSNAVADAFRAPLSELRDDRIFPADAASVRRLKISFGAASFALCQTNGQWRFEAPASEAADQLAASQAIAKLLALRREPGEPGAVGRPGPIPLCTAELYAGESAWRFRVENDTASDSALCIALASPAALFRISPTNFPAAFMSAEGILALRDKSLLALPPASLRRIAVKGGDGQSATVERSGAAAAWQTGRGTMGQIQPAALDAFITRLADLQASRVEKLALSLGELDQYGFRQPWLEISIDVESADAVRKTILLGSSPPGGGRYAMLRGQNTLFVLAPEAVAVLSAPLVK